jgi:UDP-N-acetyl-D-glucosamine dehydrogenase
LEFEAKPQQVKQIKNLSDESKKYPIINKQYPKLIAISQTKNMNYKQQILEKIASNKEVVGIIGLGYVGLPLAVNFAEAGVKVIGFEKNQQKADLVNKGDNYIGDIRDAVLREVVVEKLTLEATTDFTRMKECDALIIAVPTPLDKFRKPDMSYIEASCHAIGRYMKPGTFISLESTTYPTTTEDLMLPIIEKEIKTNPNFTSSTSPLSLGEMSAGQRG